MIVIRNTGKWWAAAIGAAVLVVGSAAPISASEPQGHDKDRDRGFLQTKLVSNIPGMALHTDPKLKNPWGISTTVGAPLWLSDNGTGLSTLYDGKGVPAPAGTPLVVTVPAAATSTPGAVGNPTGTVFNSGTGFTVSKASLSGASRFLFATEDGTLAGWAPTVDVGSAVTAVDRSKVTDPEGDVGAVYKGLTIASTPAGQFLYATNFRFGQVEVFDSGFNLVRTFTDSSIPNGYAPFGIQNISGRLFVTFAKQDAEKHDDVAGNGFGYVDVFTASGKMLQRFASRGPLDSPWAVTQAPATVPQIGGDILVGNFGNGRINVYSAKTGRFIRTLHNTQDRPISIPGLWDLKFPTGSLNVVPNALYFTAGLNHEADGLFGYLTAAR